MGCRHSGIDLLTALLRQHDSIAWCAESERFLTHINSPQIKIPQFWTEQEALVRFSAEDKRHPIESKTWIHSLDKPDARAVLAYSTDNLIAKIPWLQQHFPNAYFILMVRNGYTCALKYRDEVLKEYALHPLLLHRAARQWARSLLILQENAPDSAHLLTLRYEDLIADPTGVTNKLFDFIALPAIAPPAHIAAHQESTRLASISAEQKAVIKNAAGDMLGFYGYT